MSGPVTDKAPDRVWFWRSTSKWVDDEWHAVPPPDGGIWEGMPFVPEAAARAEGRREGLEEAAPLRAALERLVRLSDSMSREWSDGDWRAVLTTVCKFVADTRALLDAPKEGK